MALTSGDPSGGGTFANTPLSGFSGIFGGNSGNAISQQQLLASYGLVNPATIGASTPTSGGGVGTIDAGGLWGNLISVLLNSGAIPGLGGGAGAPGGTSSDGPAGGSGTPGSGRGSTKPAAAGAAGAAGGLAGSISKLSNLGQLMTQLGGVGVSALGAALSAGNIAQAQQILKGAADNYNALGAQGLNTAQPYMQGAADSATNTLNGTSPWTSLQLNSLVPQVGQLGSALPGMAQRNFATESPDIMQALGSMGGLAGSGPLQTMLDRASQNVNNGGATADSRNQFAQYQAMQSGATPVMQDLANGGAGLLASGGMTGLLQGLGASGLGSASSGGMTPQLASALAQVQGLLAGGGANSATDALTSRGLQLSSAAPLAPMSQVLSGALDAAGTRQAQAAQTARAQAEARGGGPGATVANGVSNQAMADFADQGAQAQAQAVQQAMLGQQGLQLQQTGLGASMAQGGQSLESSRLGELLNAVSNLTATSTGRMSVGGNLALGASGNATQNMGLGGNLLNSYNQGSASGGSLADAILTLEMGNQSQNMGMLNTGTGTQAGIYNNIIGSLLSGAQGGSQAGNSLGNLMLGNQNSYANILSGGQSAYGNAASLLGQLGNGYLTFGNNMYSNAGPVVTGQSQYAAQSPWGQFTGQIGSSLATGAGSTPQSQPAKAPGQP